MKHFFNSLKFIFKAFLLVIILLIGWAFINISNLIKGKKLSKNDSFSLDKFGTDKAMADVPASCPFVAYFDGEKFQIENDFLCGKLSHYLGKFSRSKMSKPDLMRFYHAPKKRNGKLAFQLQENEAEETLINRLKFIRVAHPKNSEVIINSNFENFYVIDRASLENISLAEEILVNGVKDTFNRFGDQKRFFTNGFESDSLILNKNDRLEFSFSGLEPNSEPVLIVKSTFRDWIMGEAGEAKIASLMSLFYSPKAIRVGLIFMAAIYFVFGRKTFGYWPTFLPLFFGTQAPSCSIVFSYKDRAGDFKKAAINKPRAWNFSSEAIVLPKEAIMEDGAMLIKAEFTKRHKLAFVGVLQNEINLPYRDEELCILSAKSSRLGDVTGLISSENKKSLHLIPGDTVDIEIEDPKISLNKDEKDTYLMQSFGVYTPLSSKYKKIAGNWFKKIPTEVRAYYEKYGQMADK